MGAGIQYVCMTITSVRLRHLIYHLIREDKMQTGAAILTLSTLMTFLKLSINNKHMNGIII